MACLDPRRRSVDLKFRVSSTYHDLWLGLTHLNLGPWTNYLDLQLRLFAWTFSPGWPVSTFVSLWSILTFDMCQPLLTFHAVQLVLTFDIRHVTPHLNLCLKQLVSTVVSTKVGWTFRASPLCSTFDLGRPSSTFDSSQLKTILKSYLNFCGRVKSTLSLTHFKRGL